MFWICSSILGDCTSLFLFTTLLFFPAAWVKMLHKPLQQGLKILGNECFRPWKSEFKRRKQK